MEAREDLEYAGADYSAVEAALAKILLYTKESWDALQKAKDAVQYGLTAENQKIVNSWAEDLEDRIAQLEYVDADYSKVDEAIAKIPADLTQYTDQSDGGLRLSSG